MKISLALSILLVVALNIAALEWITRGMLVDLVVALLEGRVSVKHFV